MRSTFVTVVFGLTAAAILSAQEPPTPPEPSSQGGAAAAMGGRGGITPPSQEPQPYEKVITKDAKSKKGIFTVHHSLQVGCVLR
jgi:hypothetical protein